MSRLNPEAAAFQPAILPPGASAKRPAEVGGPASITIKVGNAVLAPQSPVPPPAPPQVAPASEMAVSEGLRVALNRFAVYHVADALASGLILAARARSSDVVWWNPGEDRDLTEVPFWASCPLSDILLADQVASSSDGIAPDGGSESGPFKAAWEALRCAFPEWCAGAHRPDVSGSPAGVAAPPTEDVAAAIVFYQRLAHFAALLVTWHKDLVSRSPQSKIRIVERLSALYVALFASAEFAPFVRWAPALSIVSSAYISHRTSLPADSRTRGGWSLATAAVFPAIAATFLSSKSTSSLIELYERFRGGLAHTSWSRLMERMLADAYTALKSEAEELDSGALNQRAGMHRRVVPPWTATDFGVGLGSFRLSAPVAEPREKQRSVAQVTPNSAWEPHAADSPAAANDVSDALRLGCKESTLATFVMAALAETELLDAAHLQGALAALDSGHPCRLPSPVCKTFVRTLDIARATAPHLKGSIREIRSYAELLTRNTLQTAAPSPLNPRVLETGSMEVDGDWWHAPESSEWSALQGLGVRPIS